MLPHDGHRSLDLVETMTVSTYASRSSSVLTLKLSSTSAFVSSSKTLIFPASYPSLNALTSSLSLIFSSTMHLSARVGSFLQQASQKVTLALPFYYIITDLASNRGRRNRTMERRIGEATLVVGSCERRGESERRIRDAIGEANRRGESEMQSERRIRDAIGEANRSAESERQSGEMQ